VEFKIKGDKTSAPMKILHLANHVQEIGNGIVNVVIDLACSQADAGHDVLVASAGGEYETLLARHGVRHVHLAQEPKPAKFASMCWKFNRLIRREKPHVVHVHMMTGALIARIMRLGRTYRIVGTVHNEFQRSAKVMGFADLTVAVSSAVAQSMERRGIPASRLRTVTNGTIDSPRRDPDAERPAVVELLLHPNVVTIAGMYRRKGIGVLVDAFSRIDKNKLSAHLYVIGNGPDRAEFEAQAVRLAMADRVHFLGFQTDAPAFLAQTDVFALASFKDPCPLVISEAREAGCAIVGSNVDGIPQALDFGDAGMLVPPGDVDALADALQAMLTDKVARENWQARAKANLDRLRVSRVSRDYLSIYEEVIGRVPTTCFGDATSAHARMPTSESV
jgi:glycosyltransferase involved in cell wall biosynthesis